MHAAPHLPNSDELRHDDHIQLEAPLKLSVDEQIEQLRPQKEYGPKAIYKDGIIGNFEPVVGANRIGPGMLSQILS